MKWYSRDIPSGIWVLVVNLALSWHIGTENPYVPRRLLVDAYLTKIEHMTDHYYAHGNYFYTEMHPPKPCNYMEGFRKTSEIVRRETLREGSHETLHRNH